ncbi:MAG TPA: acyl-[acyl-carrier-protein] thioesterase [Leptospiraceae bacterium]|nr:acyl-[acyl-carrier-protein] thioesterase [Leptospiraceae bacterium]HNF14858.1 acyl-[acyl-carrier-protein] thioesterase [Leptospiraceae bacterium]HNF22921.1 acyl-[acyl-carrier-protein] thioesterase [Leptospiraceae bacterium]HNH08189.1 acyl-[acyl-carrier-protein] thioesterase [Leptospiraceae bacterium]HNI98389.1 acyl-[acyl-carrier-protein] thioesterase [Leptospiraceae bacterium]
MIKKSVSIETRVFDLDWNRHVTSRTYERFSLEGRHSILADLGYPIQKCIQENLILIPKFTEVRFLAQQFSGTVLRVDTVMEEYRNGLIFWDHKIYDPSEKLACELKLVTQTQDGKGQTFLFTKTDLTEPENLIHSVRQFTGSCRRLENPFRMLFSDMSCFWVYPAESVWKIFEEGRWLFFGDIVDTKKIKEHDTTSFFMGGKIQIFRLPEAGEKAVLYSWIESVDKIRFYFRQDLADLKGNVFASMRDEQLFVSLSASRPRKAPQYFLETVGEYVEFLK